jgi:hypothetical protein
MSIRNLLFLFIIMFMPLFALSQRVVVVYGDTSLMPSIRAKLNKVDTASLSHRIDLAGGGSGTLTDVTATDNSGQTWTITGTTIKNLSLALTKTSVGLSNVDNTSDATKNAATVTLTNKTISGSANTFSAIDATSISAGSVSNTEFDYIDGVTSAIQTQLNAKGVGDMLLGTVQSVTGAKTFLDTKFLLQNVANTFNGSFTNTNTANRVYTLKDANGTIAFTSDITGTNSGTNTGDQTISISGDVTASGSTSSLSATVVKINGVELSGLATGILKNTTSTGVPSIAIAADFPTLNQNTTGSSGSVANSLSIAAELISGGATSYNGSGAKSIAIQSGSVTNAMLSGSIAASKLVGTDIATVGTITVGTWNGDVIGNSYITTALSSKTYNGLTLVAASTGFTIAGGTTSKTLTINNTLGLSGTDASTLNIGAGGTLGSAAFTASSAYEVPITFSTGLTRSTNTITVNTSQNIATLSNLTSNGLIKTSGGTGALSIATAGTDYANVGANTDITSILLNQTGLVVKGASSNALTIKPNETLSAGRTLNLIVNDVSRTIDLSGNLTVSSAATISGTNTGDQTTISGNAATATILATSRNINGTAFNGSADITVTAAAGTLTGTTLNSSVVTSSLTSVGTITTGVWSGTAIANNKLANSTISGISLGSNLGTLTFGSHLITGGSSYNGSAGVTITSDAVSTATASVIALRDANANLLANSFYSGYTTTATAGGNTALSLSSTQLQFFTGSTTQTVTMPNTSLMALGSTFTIVNNSTGALTIKAFDDNTGYTMRANSYMILTQIATSTGIEAWNYEYIPISLSTNTAYSSVLRDASGNFSAGTISAALTGNASTSTTLATTRAIYGNNFDGSAALTQIIASTYGGTGNGFAKFSGATSTEKTYTLPDATTTILTTNDVVTVGQGGTGVGTLTGALVGTGTTAIVGSNVSLTELNYVDGVTSAIQTQIDSKQATLVSATNIKTINGSTILGSGDLVVSGGGITIGTTTITSGTTTRVLYDNAGVVGEMTTTGSGTQLALSASPTFTGTVVIPTSFTLGATTVTTTGTQLNYINTATGTTGTNTTNLVYSTSPTITTPAITGLATGSGVASAATASTLVTRDANANIFANNFVSGYATTATAGGTTTLTISDYSQQYFTGTLAQTVKLPTTGIVIGQSYRIYNKSTGLVTVQSSGANTITVMAGSTNALFTAVANTPTAAADWNGNYRGDIVASGKSFNVSNSLTLAGTDGTTMTFPSTSATIARTDAANTFSGLQTVTQNQLLLSGSFTAAADNDAMFKVSNTMTGTKVSQGFTISPTFTPTASVAAVYGSVMNTTVTPSAAVTITENFGSFVRTDYTGNNGAVTTAYAFHAAAPTASGTLKPATNYGVYVANQGLSGITTSYGLYVGSQSGSTTNWAAYFAGGNVGIGSGIVPTANDGAALGTTSLNFSDLFLATGAVLNYNNGNVTITHAANLLTIAGGGLITAAGTTSLTPLNFPSTSVLRTTSSVGDFEFDNKNLYFTPESTSGRGYVPDYQRFRLTANGSTISTIANFFGSTSNPTLVSGGEYLIEIDLYYTNTTAGTVTWTFTNSAAPTSQNIHASFSPVAGIVAPAGSAAATYLEGDIQGDATAAKALTTSGTLTTATTQWAHFSIHLYNSTGTSLKIQATKLVGGTITPLKGSYWTCQRIPSSNTGTFAN